MEKLAIIVQQLQQERARIDAALQALTGAISNNLGSRGTASSSTRTMSAVARRKIAAAQRARWAKWKAKKKGS